MTKVSTWDEELWNCGIWNCVIYAVSFTVPTFISPSIEVFCTLEFDVISPSLKLEVMMKKETCNKWHGTKTGRIYGEPYTNVFKKGWCIIYVLFITYAMLYTIF